MCFVNEINVNKNRFLNALADGEFAGGGGGIRLFCVP